MLQRAILHESVCNLESCEVEIHTTSKSDSIFIHRKIMKLTPVDKYVVKCAALSEYKISVWHNELATKIGNNFLLHGGLIPAADIENKTAANEEVRTIKTGEQILGLFIVFGKWIQCLRKETFWMNQQEIHCNSMEIFPLPDKYTVTYSGKKLVEHKIVRKNQKIGLQKYKSILPDESLEENENPVVAIHPLIDEWVTQKVERLWRHP